jgi:hypothetical protein
MDEEIMVGEFSGGWYLDLVDASPADNLHLTAVERLKWCKYNLNCKFNSVRSRIANSA